MEHLALACHSFGAACEWAMEADSREILLQRFAEHQKCAHHVPELSVEQRHKAATAIRTV